MRRRRRGFTLLEILVVIVIIAGISTLIIPQFGDLFQTNLKGAVRRLTGTVKFCFHESVIKQQIIRLQIDPVTGEYWPTILAVGENNIGQFVDLPGSLAGRGRLPDGIRFVDVVTPHDVLKNEEEIAFISFFPTGFAERAVIHMEGGRENFFTLVVEPLTGEVEILDGYVDIVDTQPTQGPFSQDAF
ncbi:type II secretion system protein [bacterium]|nr:type II secretion system protein [bacterium]